MCIRDRLRRGGIITTGVVVEEGPDAPNFPTLADVQRWLSQAALSPFVRDGALKTFRLLGEAEARAHDVAAEHVHFHEVGALDAMVDVIGSLWLIERLRPERVVVSPLRLGKGSVRAAHGDLPIPAPATAELLRGVPCFAGDTCGEFTTPTGAALVAALADEFGSWPVMRLLRTGYGPGAADPADFINVLRVYLGEQDRYQSEDVVVIEAHVDDMTSEELAAAARAAEEAGALDVTLAPVVMKKGRPGHIFKAIVTPPRQNEIVEVILRHTTTLGVRLYGTRRVTLPRYDVLTQTPYGPGKVKVATAPDGSLRFHAEYDDALKLASAAGVPLRVAARALEDAARVLVESQL